MPTLDRHDDVFVLDLGDTENRFHPDWLTAVHSALDEVDIGLPFTVGMSALVQARLVPQTAHEAMTTGRRYGGDDARTAGIVEHAVAEDAVRGAAVELAAAQTGRAGPTLGTIKARM